MAKNSNGQTIGYTEEMRVQREAVQQVGSSVLSWLNPFSYSWTTWILVGILGFVGYSALSKGDGKSGGFLSKLLDMLPEGVQEWIAGTASGVDGKAALALRKIAQRDGEDGLQTTDYLKPTTLFNAMVEQPQALLKVAQEMKPGEGDEKITKQAMAAVRQLVNDPEKLATLLDDKHKANTYALLETLSPVPLKAGALGKFIDATAKRDGKVDPAFVQLLNTLLTDGSLSDRIKPQEVSTFFSRKGNAEAFGTLLKSVDEGKLTGKHRELLDTLRKHWGNLNDGLAEVVADKASLQFLLTMSSKPETTVGKIAGMVPDSIKTAIGQTLPAGVTGLPDKVGENAGHLLLVQQAFKDAGVEMGGTAAAPKRPGAAVSVTH